MTPQSKTYVLTRDEFERLRVALNGQGIETEGDTGELSGEGVKGTYSFTAPQLTLTVTDKPFWMPVALIWSRVGDAIRQVLAEKPGCRPLAKDPKKDVSEGQ